MKIPAHNHHLHGDLDVVTMGEALIDLISVEETDHLRNARRFEKYQGGSPANIAANVAKLGGKSALIAKTGDDAFGQFFRSELEKSGVITDYVTVAKQAHTSLVFVSRTKGTPDFDAFRDADFRLGPTELDVQAIKRTKVLHVSTWPLSKEPFRSTVEKAFRVARAANKIITLDPNYSEKIWPDHREAQEIITSMLRYVTITKPSLDDAQRLLGPGYAPADYIERFHEMGAPIVILTMGAAGTMLSDQGTIVHIPAREIQVADATGAGDSFWSGFLTALIDGHTLHDCARFAREIAEIKLTTVGPLPEHIDRQAIYSKIFS